MIPEQVSPTLVEQIEALSETLALMILRDSLEEYSDLMGSTTPLEYADEFLDTHIDVILYDLAETIGIRTSIKFHEIAAEKIAALEKKSLEFTKRPPAKVLKFPPRIHF